MLTRDHVIGQNPSESGLGLGFDERFDRARREFCEGRVGRRKDGKRACTFECIDKPGRGYGGYERFECARTDSGIYNICHVNFLYTSRNRELMKVKVTF